MLEKCYLLKFPKTCAKATRISVVSKSNKNSDNGKRIVEEPKPAIVPPISAINAIIKNRVIKYSISTMNITRHLQFKNKKNEVFYIILLLQ